MDLLTPAEIEAVRQAGLLHNFIAQNIVADGPTRDDDLAEFTAAIHTIQRGVMAQAAARAYPDEYRLLGGTVKVLDELPPPDVNHGRADDQDK